MTARACVDCGDVTDRTGTLGEALCNACIYQRTLLAIEIAGGSKIMATTELKKCTSCGFARLVAVTRVDGGPPEFPEMCPMCVATVAAKAHERQARDLRRLAAAILKKRRAASARRKAAS